jgi:GR25 family glycosyltransferase involved in LPS biosynthesis
VLQLGISLLESLISLNGSNKSNMFDSFVINLDTRPDRLREFTNQDLPPTNIKRLAASKGGMIGCTRSHLRAMAKFKDDINGVFEDDCKFQNLYLFQDAISELPNDWDALYLGYQKNGKSIQPYSQRLNKVKSVFATHAILYNGTKISDYILKNWNTKSIHKKYRSIDSFMVYEIQTRFNVYCTTPLMAIQRVNMSDTNNQIRRYEFD